MRLPKRCSLDPVFSFMSADPPPLTYSDFWKFRGRQSFWLTRHVGYRLGALLALIAFRMGLSPHCLTALSFLTGVGGAVIVGVVGMSQFAAGILLLCALQLSYGLDCADGVLARATNRTSRSGALLDKIADLSGSLIIPGILGAEAFHQQNHFVPHSWYPFLLWWSLAPRAMLTMLMWLKDGMTPQIDRKGAVDTRPKTLFWRIKKFAGNITDDITYRTGLALSWATGCYWDFTLVFHSIGFLMLLVYIVSSVREIAAADE